MDKHEERLKIDGGVGILTVRVGWVGASAPKRSPARSRPRTLAWTLVMLSLGACCPRVPSTVDLRDKLWNDALQVFDQRRAVLTDAARKPLRDFVESGAAELEASHASGTDVCEAEDKVRALAIAMVESADRNPQNTKGVVEVLEKDFQAVRKKICPLYPFCK